MESMMAASTQMAASSTNPMTAQMAKADLQQGWEAYRKNAEPHGLAFGKVVYDFRATAEGVQGGTTFRATLAELGIPKSTAYFWMSRYEVSIGVRKEVEERVPSQWEGLRDCAPRGNTPHDITPFGGTRTDGYFSHEYIGHPPEGSGITEDQWQQMSAKEHSEARELAETESGEVVAAPAPTAEPAIVTPSKADIAAAMETLLKSGFLQVGINKHEDEEDEVVLLLDAIAHKRNMFLVNQNGSAELEVPMDKTFFVRAKEIALAAEQEPLWMNKPFAATKKRIRKN